MDTTLATGETVKYCIGRGVIGPGPFVDISSDDFELVRKARRNVFVLLGIEEKFDMVVDNYLEYERDLLSLALAYMAAHSINWSSFHDAMSLVNRRLANVLTVARLYIDQVKHDLSRIYGKDAHATTRVCQAFSMQYDRLLGYRVMEGVRNVLQHRSLPVTGLAYPAAWEDRKKGQLLHHRVTAQLQVTQLRDASEFKRSVIQELELSGEDTQDITPFVRQYVEGLSCVHDELRAVTNADMELSKKTILKMIERYHEVCGEDDPGSVVAYQLDDEDTTIEEVTIFREGIDRLERLRNKQLPTRVSQWFVSNESV